MSLAVNVMSPPGNTVVGIETGDQIDDGAADFESAFRTHYPRLVRALTVLAGDPDTAADAVQDAFVKAHLKWRKVSRYDDPIGWVRRVAINRLHDGHRRNRRKRRAVERLAAQPRDHVELTEPNDLGASLAALPRQQRAVVALYYVDGASVAEVAAALGLAEGTVKSHLHDARNRLRPVLEAQQRGEVP